MFYMWQTPHLCYCWTSSNSSSLSLQPVIYRTSCKQCGPFVATAQDQSWAVSVAVADIWWILQTTCSLVMPKEAKKTRLNQTFKHYVSAYAIPLMEIQRNGHSFNWREVHDWWFQMIKNLACKYPILKPIDPRKEEPIWLVCNTFLYGSAHCMGKDIIGEHCYGIHALTWHTLHFPLSWHSTISLHWWIPCFSGLTLEPFHIHPGYLLCLDRPPFHS